MMVMMMILTFLSPLEHSDNRSASLYMFRNIVAINIRTFYGLFAALPVTKSEPETSNITMTDELDRVRKDAVVG
jgi:hypothetical protein